MFKTLLYPTDFSDVSDKALDYIRELSGSGIRKIVLLHVIDQREFKCFEQGVAWAGQLPEEFEDKYRQHVTEEASNKLEGIAARIRDMGLQVDMKLVIGIPFHEILKAEDQEPVSAIIIGSHGKSNVREMMLGSVSEKVIRKSRTPVIVIKR